MTGRETATDGVNAAGVCTCTDGVVPRGCGARTFAGDPDSSPAVTRSTAPLTAGSNGTACPCRPAPERRTIERVIEIAAARVATAVCERWANGNFMFRQ